jgi:hypothetical protein
MSAFVTICRGFSHRPWRSSSSNLLVATQLEQLLRLPFITTGLHPYDTTITLLTTMMAVIVIAIQGKSIK